MALILHTAGTLPLLETILFDQAEVRRTSRVNLRHSPRPHHNLKSQGERRLGADVGEAE